MSQYPRYTTFRPGELETCLHEIMPQAALSFPTSSNTMGRVQIKNHTFTVTFPDGQAGTCRYERKAPGWHLYGFTYADGTPMPRQTTTQRLHNEVAVIEAKGQELAALCYQEAIREERRDYFQRAAEPAGGIRKKRPEKYRMKAAKAKEMAGQYALCEPLGDALFPVGVLRDTLESANADWKEREDVRLVVGCCNRLDRCWECPKFNPLYALWEMRPDFLKTGVSPAHGAETAQAREEGLAEEEEAS